MPQPIPIEIRLTRTPIGGAADVAIVQSMVDPRNIIKAASTRSTQSVGVQSGSVLMDNEGARFTGYAPFDAVKIEARCPGKGGFYTLLDGFLDEPTYPVGGEGESRARLVVLGWMARLDLVQLDSDVTYTETAYTTMANNLISLVLGGGYSRSITADAATGTLTFPEGMKLRQALEMIRSGLNTAADKWEHKIDVVAGAQQYRLFKRSATVQATIQRRQLRAGSMRSKGSVTGIANKVTVIGANVVGHSVDKSTLAAVGNARLDSATDAVAQPFFASDSPLYSVTTYAARSTAQDPPNLNAYVARSSDNVDFLSHGYLYKKAANRSPNIAPSADVTDDVNNTRGFGTAGLGPGDVELIAYDLGVARTVDLARLAYFENNNGGVCNMKIQSSTDDAAWTTRASFDIGANVTKCVFSALGGPITARYWRLAVDDQRIGGGRAVDVYSFDLLPMANLSADCTNPNTMQQDNHAPTSMGDETATRVATTGAVSKELFRTQLDDASTVWAKIVVKHQESQASGLVNLLVQRSDNGSTWTTIATLPSATSVNTDSIYYEGEAFQYLRLLLDDGRSGGSSNIDTDGFYVQAYPHTTMPYYPAGSTVQRPLTGDKMAGSGLGWNINDLVVTPGFLAERTYTAPTLAMVGGYQYWLVFLAAGGTASSWWDLSYGTESGVEDARTSTDGGVTWSAALATDAVLRYKLGFNFGPLVGFAEDAASQAIYGVIAFAAVDNSLMTQDAVDKEAAMIVNRCKLPKDKLITILDPDYALVDGQMVTLTEAAARVFGYTSAQNVDVVEVLHDMNPDNPSTTLVCNEHVLDPGDDANLVAMRSNERRA